LGDQAKEKEMSGVSGTYTGNIRKQGFDAKNLKRLLGRPRRR
jgi:hypothetical protein